MFNRFTVKQPRPALPYWLIWDAENEIYVRGKNRQERRFQSQKSAERAVVLLNEEEHEALDAERMYRTWWP